MSEHEDRSGASENAWAESEPELIDRCVRDIPARRESAFRSLVKHYESAVHGLALHITGSQQDAEEVVQDTFMRVHKHLARFDGRCAFPTWLISIAKKESFRKLRMLCRIRRRNQEIEQEWNQGAEEPWCEGPEPQGGSKLREVFSSCLACLRVEERRILLLRVDQGLSLTEIAEVLGIGLSAAKMRLSRAIRALDKAYHLEIP